MTSVSSVESFGRTERWYLVHTHGWQEQKARHHLEAQGFSVFLPLIQKTVRHARQLKTVSRPLFPRYLFVKLDLNRDRWLSIRNTIGVSNLIAGADSRPTAAPFGVVEALLEQCDARHLVRLDKNLSRGDRVRILKGPFADFVGKLDSLDDPGRVRVLLDMMGTTVPIVIHRTALSPAA